MRRLLIPAFAAAALAFAATSADATIVITTDQQDAQGQNVLFGPTIGATEGNTVYGETQSGFGLTFTSTQYLLADGGQASIAADGEDLNNLAITATSALGFDYIEFNLSNAGTSGTAQSVTIYGVDQNGNTYSQFYDDLSNGANMYLLLSDQFQYITSVSFSVAEGGFSSIDQIRVGPGTDVAVPEPATWAMMLLGFGAAGFTIRRHRKKLISQLA